MERLQQAPGGLQFSSFLMAACIAACSSATSYSQTIEDIGSLPGAVDTIALALSEDGTTVVGQSGTATGNRAFRWRRTTGIQDMGSLSTAITLSAWGVSRDGSVVAGYASGPGIFQAFRWTGSGGYQTLGVLPGSSDSYAYGLSADGTSVVGNSSQRAFRWRQATGMQFLGTLPGGNISHATGVSADGSVVAGYSTSSNGTRAYRWTSTTGLQELPIIPGFTQSIAQAISSNGTTITGWVSQPGIRLFRWTQSTGMQDLGTSLYPYGISASGDIIVGGDSRAFVWTQTGGVQDLNVLLPQLGVDLTGWTLKIARGVTPDGRVIAGNGIYNGQPKSWLVQIPCLTPLQIGQQPASQTVCRGGTAVFSVTATPSNQVAFQWRRANVPIADGSKYSGTATQSLIVSDVQSTDVSSYSCVVSNGCASASSQQASLNVCLVDFDCNGRVELTDVFVFLNSWFAGSPQADFNAFGGVSLGDIFDYLNAWFTGC